MTESLQDCLTCRRKTENFLRILDETNAENVEVILTKHFWFKTMQYEDRVLCISCWEKIEEFHKFYCEVEERWSDELNLPDAVVKMEQTDEEESVPQPLFTEELVKSEQDLEPVGTDEGSSSSADSDDDKDNIEIEEDKVYAPEDDFTIGTEDDGTEESEEESSIPVAKRKKSSPVKAPARKKPRETRWLNSQKQMNVERNQLITKYCRLECDVCKLKIDTFSRLLLHYRKVHKTQGFVTCCERSYTKKCHLYAHLLRHETGERELLDDLFQCEVCDPVKSFKDEEGLQLHNVVCHSEEGEKIHKCDLCDKAFTSEWALSGHKNWHQNVESLNIRCEKCNKYFYSVRTLNTHTKAHHPEESSDLPETTTNITQSSESTSVPKESKHKPPLAMATSFRGKKTKSPEDVLKEDEFIRRFCTLICEKCDFAGENYYALEKHYKIEHDMRGYAICCGRKFCKKRRLYEHCQRHINPDMFRCEICNKSFTESDGLEKHNKWVHTPDSEKPFKCEICDAAFYKEYLLRNHMKYHISMEQKIFSCKDCDKSFGTAVLLRAHQQNVHGAASSWVCDICAKGFVHKSQLETHRLSHSEEGAASLKKQCENCKKWLKNKDTHQNHLKRCLAGGPVTCDICGKEAVNELALASHKRFNHEERPAFACSYCGKQFKRILRLKEHEANHRGEVLYSCPYCPRTCNSSSNMYTHKKVAHPELWAAKVAERFYKR